MSIVTVLTNRIKKSIDLQNIETKPYLEQIELFTKTDKMLLNINEKKYQNAIETIQYIKSIRSPENISIFKISLLSLMMFFNKTYVTNTFKVKLHKIPQHVREKLDLESINIISKTNNFPHLIGISGLRDNSGNIISKARPREFLDGVLYQFILLHSHDKYKLDLEKLEVFPWMHQTLLNPTYILPSTAIITTGTKIKADLIFIRKIFDSDKYVFHIIGLKNENGTNFAFKTQFAISKDRGYRLKKMFNLEEAIFDFYKEKNAPISSGQAGSTHQKISRDYQLK